jgi:hypothetical protein
LPPLGALVALLGLPRISLRRVALALGLLVVATVLTIVALVELAHALRLALLIVLDPAWVALIIGAGLLLVAALLGLTAWRLGRPLPPPPRPTPAPGATTAEGDLLTLAIAWVRAHPQQATVLAAVLGFLTGALPEARRALADILGPPR